MTFGYSGTPLVKKLGIKPGFRIAILNAPADYAATLGELPPEVIRDDTLQDSLDLIHFFARDRTEFESHYDALKAALKKEGALWISWYKKSARIPTDLTEDVIRDHALANGLVDVKVAAVDNLWSGLKLVYRVKDRT
ncbi:MAG: DUF3052 domain-containing protein [Anaerolineae bacterium]